MLSVEVVGPLDADEVRAVSALVEAATEADGVRPLSEHVMLHLRYGGDERVRNVLAWSGDDLRGYGHLDVTDEVAGASAEIVVHPSHRGEGLGRALVETTLAETPDGRLRLWAHGDHPGASVLGGASSASTGCGCSGRCGGRCSRRCPDVPLPDGVALRAFRARRRRRGLAQGSTRAPLQTHPRAGSRWTLEDLRDRSGRAVVRPGRLPARGRVQTIGCSAFTGRRCTRRRGGRAPTHADEQSRPDR